MSKRKIYEWKDAVAVGRLVTFQTERMPETKIGVISEVNEYAITVRSRDGLSEYGVGYNSWLRYLCECCGELIDADSQQLRCKGCPPAEYQKHVTSVAGELQGKATKYAPKKKKSCKVCEASYLPRWGGQICCDDCRTTKAGKEARRRERKPVHAPRTCVKCQEEYVPTSGPQKTCQDCREKKAATGTSAGRELFMEPTGVEYKPGPIQSYTELVAMEDPDLLEENFLDDPPEAEPAPAADQLTTDIKGILSRYQIIVRRTTEEDFETGITKITHVLRMGK